MPKRKEKEKKDKNTSTQLVHHIVNVNVKQKADKKIPSRHGLQRGSQSN